MLNMLKLVRQLFAPRLAPPPPHLRRAVLQVEALEDRWCPAGLWTWAGDGPVGVNNLWSDPGGGNWVDPATGALAAPGKYPGMPGSLNDDVRFIAPQPARPPLPALLAGPATLDILLPNTIQSLDVLPGWMNTLTLEDSLEVTGANGFFSLNDTSTISLGAGVTLGLVDLGPAPPNGVLKNFWLQGNITGASDAKLIISGSALTLENSPGSLGVNTIIQSSPATGNPGEMNLFDMINNLTLSGADNFIDVQGGGSLQLIDHILAGGVLNAEGGLALAAAHTGTDAVQVEVGGTVLRSDAADQGVIDSVSIAGTVVNIGGLVQVNGPGAILDITGQGASGISYWQPNNAGGRLQVDANANLKAAGLVDINGGSVTLTVPSAGPSDVLDSAGLIFGNDNATSLNITDAVPRTHGTITVQGGVSLAANTTTSMSYSGSANTADQLNVQNGALTLNGRLNLLSSDGNKPNPNQALRFFADGGVNPALTGQFTSISDGVSGTDSWAFISGNPMYWALTIH